MKFIFLDTETTGTGPEDRLCQVAYSYGEHRANSLFKPPVPIQIAAMATSHITNRMVEASEPFIGSHMHKELTELFADPETVFIAHNASFDIDMLKREGIVVPKFICTMKVARSFDEKGDFEKTSLQYLRYFLDVEVPDARAHDAAGDVAVLEVVFSKLLTLMVEKTGLHGDALLNHLIEISVMPSLIRKMPFGKHRGVMMSEIPMDYLEWLLTTTLEPDMKFSVMHFIGERSK